MHAQKPKEETFEIREVKKALKFYEEVTGISLGEDLPQINILPSSEIHGGGSRKGNKINIAKEEWERKDKSALKGVVCHESFHWAVWKSGLKSNYYSYPGYKFALPLRFLLVKDIPEDSITVNAIEEGSAALFASMLISKNENEIPKNMFYLYFYENPSIFQKMFNSVSYKKVKKVINEVYTTYQKFNGLQPGRIKESLKEAEFQISELINKCYKLFPTPRRWEALHKIGRTTVLFAYEIYKKENKNSKDLLKDLTFSPWEVVERVVEEIKKDKDEEILKNTLSDFENGFKKHLREEKPSFMQRLVNKAKEFKKRVRD